MTVLNEEKLTRQFREIPFLLRKPALDAVRRGALRVQRDAIESIRAPGKGRVYPRGKKSHQASAPGDPPASDTGKLLGSVEVLFRNEGLIAEIGTALNYGAFLEFGTRKMQPRPWLTPALKKNEARIINEIRTAMLTALRKVGAIR